MVAPVKLQPAPIDHSDIKVTHLQSLGSGSQGEVFTCYINNEKSKIFVAKGRKIINNKDLARKVYEEMQREYSIGRSLKHPNIVEYFYFVKKESGERAEYNMILELMDGGNLRDFVKENAGWISIEQIKSIGRQVLKGLDYLHGENVKIIH